MDSSFYVKGKVVGNLHKSTRDEEARFLDSHPELQDLFPQFLFTYLSCRAAGVAESLEGMYCHMFGDLSMNIQPCKYCNENMERKKQMLDHFSQPAHRDLDEYCSDC